MENKGSMVKGQYARIIFLAISSFVLLIIVIATANSKGGDFNINNLITNLMYQFFIFMPIGVSTFVVMSSGGIDFSIGSLIALSGIIVVSFNGSLVGSIIAILVCLIFGFLNGFIAVKTPIKPFIITMATMTLIRYIGLTITQGGMPIRLEADFQFSQFFFIQVLLSLLVIGLSCFLLKENGNIEKSNNGITKIKNDTPILFYMLSAFSASIAGIFFAFRIRAGVPNIASGYEMDAIIIAVLGGALMSYATINIFSTIISALLLVVLTTFFNLLSMDSFISNILKIVVLFIGFIPIIKKNGLTSINIPITIPVKKSTLRIISRVAILLVVMGFFMPMGCDQTGFELAERLGKATNDTSFGIALYGLFISALIGGGLLIPLAMKKKVHIAFDWISSVVSFVFGIFVYSQWGLIPRPLGRLELVTLTIKW